ncbi:MAG: precorrin-3B C(17)-methyltransferase [Bacillota bacterium]|nr:precorrin-3B C(17)-methyltransferase [Bacillota bacterium]
MKSGKVYVVGTGPGAVDLLTARAVEALKKCEMVIGYHLYVNQIVDLLVEDKQEVVYSAMGREVERCRQAVDEAARGKDVALVSGGDPGIYGMAGILLQVAQEKNPSPAVEIISGVTAASEAAAVLGAPLTHDFSIISLSDLLTPWEVIEKRLRAAAEADFVIVIYNPRSHGRSDLLYRAREIIMGYRSPENAVGMVRRAGREDQQHWQTNLEGLEQLIEQADMATILIIGNSKTYWQQGRMITPRGYEL